MFCGISTHSLDAKSRVFVPKRIQDGLTKTATGGLQGYLTPGEDSCLYLFTVEGFRAAASELNTRVFGSDEARAARRLFFGASVPVELDSSGRILLPEELRSGIGIDKEVVIVGVEDRAELWPVKAWKSYREKHAGVLAKLNRIAGEKPAAPGPGS
jgi:MraZ protein